MMVENSKKTPRRSKQVLKRDRQLRFLSEREINLIDSALSSVGSFGEVKLMVEKGRLRFIASTTSYDALKWDQVEIEQEDNS